MIDVLKRLAELDAKNPNIVKENASQLVPGKFYVVGQGDRAVAGPFDDEGEAENQKAEYSQGGREDAAVAQWAGNNWNFDYMMSQDMAESLDECGMMGGMSHPHSPASVNMTAATGEELSAMLKDIMTLAGRPMQEPMGSDEPVGGANGVAVVDTEPEQEPVGGDEPSIMRSMMDKLNPEPEDDEEEKVDEYGITDVDTTPSDATDVPDYDQDAMIGGEHNRDQSGAPGAAKGRNNMNNPVAMPMEQRLMAEYRKFINEN